MNRKALAAIAAAGMILPLGASAALAHNASSNKCAKWHERGGYHDTNSSGYYYSEQAVARTGHYVVRENRGSNASYVEVVGGGSYNDNSEPPSNGNQGGFAQGEIKPAGVDFHANSFAGTVSPNTAGLVNVHADVCVGVAGQRVGTDPGADPNPSRD